MVRARTIAKPGRVRLGLAVVFATVAGALAPAAGADEADWLYDPTRVVEIDLELGPEGLEALAEQPDKHVPGGFTARVDGEVVGTPLEDVGIRLKGSSGSFRPLSRKPAFKVKFDKFVKGRRFFGLEGITLNNMVQDPSMVHETLTYDLFRSMGLAAPRTGYALTRLNGEVIGVHVNVEQYDEVSLPAHFPTTRHLYEGDVPGTDVLPGRAAEFEVDEGDEEDRSDLEALIAAADAQGGDWSDGMAAVADLAQMTRVWAVERYVAHWDGYAGTLRRPNNYFLHSDEEGVFRMLPWGADQTWGGGAWGRNVAFGVPNGGVLFNRCLADESCKLLYHAALAEIEALLPSLDLLAKTRAYAATLAPHRALEPPARREHSAREFTSGVKAVEAFIAKRPRELRAYLAHGGPSPPALPAPRLEPLAPTPRPVPTFGRTRWVGARIETPVRAAVAGAATQSVRVRRAGRWAHACAARAAVTPSGRSRLSCRLPGPVVAARARRDQRLRVRLDFVPESGERRTVHRILRLPRLR